MQHIYNTKWVTNFKQYVSAGTKLERQMQYKQLNRNI